MLQELINRLNKLEADLKIEFLLSEIMEKGIDMDEMIIHSIGSFSRRYSRDLNKAYESEIPQSNKKHFTLDVNRDGLYDGLPEGLFHQPRGGRGSNRTKEIIEEIKIQKSIEQDSRTFFLPFEQELYRLKLLLETEEKKCIFDPLNAFENDVLIDFWEIPPGFNEHQTCNLLYLLPFAHTICGNFKLTERCFESLLNTKFTILKSAPFSGMAVGSPEAKLHDIFLGVDFTLEDTYQEYNPSLKIILGPMYKSDALEYQQGGKNKAILDFLYYYFLPFENDHETLIDIADEEKDFVLSENPWDGNLGITSFV